MQRGKRAVRWVTALLAASACEPAPPQPEAAIEAIAARDPSPEPVPTPAVPRPWPVPGIDDAAPLYVIVTDPRVLEHWDAAAARPLALHAILARLHRARGWPQPGAQGPGGDVLAAFGPSWGAIADTLDADVGRIVADLAIDWETDIDRTYDVTAAKTELGADAAHRGNGNVARVFAAKWLRSPDARVPLVAMVYRPDRADFLPGTCGELRLVYRLAYERTHGHQVVSSRLPLTINVVFTIPDDGDRCRQVARSFRAPALTDDASARAVADTLLAGPLHATRSVLAQIEVNAQIVRFPSDLERVDGRHFAGQALYWLRIFAPAREALAPIGLENTPDVQAIRADPARKARLLEHLRTEVDGIDRGLFQLPDDLLARVALSWSTHGSARLANRPFAAILDHADAETVLAGASSRQFVTGAAALLERLDGATCMGCHQSASTAGFHLLGVDRPFGTDPRAQAIATDGNRLQSPISPHLVAEIARRTAYAERVAAGEEPARVRPHPSAPIADWAGGAPRYAAARTGMPCTLPDTLAPPANWSCAAPTQCRALAVRDGVAPLLGQCVAPPTEVTAGAACREVTIATPEVPGASGLAFNARAFTDRVSVERPLYAMGQGALTTGAYNCRPPSIGVPLGRVTRRCRETERRLDGFAGAAPSEVCAIVGGKGFEQMARGAFDPIAFAKGVGRGLLDTCTAEQPCREDYICQQLPEFLADAHHRVDTDRITALHARGIGFCTPTYFVYQLRLDGHPSP